MRPPAAPDPYQTATAQSGADRDAIIASALINNYDETSPFGSVAYTRGDDQTYTDSQGNEVSVPSFGRDVTLSPEQQALYDLENQAGQGMGELALSQIDRLGNVLNEPFDPTLPDAGQIDPESWSRGRVEEAIMSRAEPYFNRQRTMLDTALKNQGLAPGSEAYNEQMGGLDRQYNDAIMQAILAGGQEQTRAAGLDMDQAATQSGLRSTSLQEQMARRSVPINEVSALMSGSQTTVPQFSAPYRQGAAAPDVAGLISQQYGRDVDLYNSRMGGLFGLGRAMIGGFV